MTTPPTYDTLVRQVAARDRTIAVLIDKVEQRFDRLGSDLDVTIRMAGLEQVVTRRTDELAKQKAELERALGVLHQTQAQLLQAQKLEAVGQLAAGIAHEINTPMQYIGDNAHFLQKAFTELLAATADLDLETIDPGRARRLRAIHDRVPRALASTVEGVETVARIVGAMKEFSHPGDGAKAPCNLNHCVLSTIEVARNEWKYVAELGLDLAADLPLVPGLQGDLNQVLLNIIVNAAHALGDRAGGVLGHIRVRTWATDDAVHVEIADDGPGIPATIQDRVFDPFFTTKPVGKGTGQGLAIARSIIVDKHQGSLRLVSPYWADAAPGAAGTSFTISLLRNTPQRPTLKVAAVNTP